MLHDISKPHKILTIHAELQINEDHSKNLYYHNVTKRDISTAPLVPLLPGHCVIGKFGKLYIYLEIQSNNECLTYHWKIYNNVEMSQIIHEGTNLDFFVSMKKYINWSGNISIPDILGFGNPDIIHDLQAKVNSIYPNIFETSVALTKSQNKMVKLTAKARNSSLISQDPIICQAIEIKETGVNLSSEATLALTIDYESSKKSSDALLCQGITEYNNESPGTKFSLLAAGAGLVDGVNRRQLQTIFSMMGVTTQSSKGHYYDKQNEYLESVKNEAEVSAQIALTKAIAYISKKNEKEYFLLVLIVP
ncbi:1174_t:CDS:2, partial [Entrophospora sp. SA101]